VEPGNLSTRPIALKLLVCTKTHCAQRVVQLKRYTTDAAARALNGPALLHALQTLMTEKGIPGKVLETSCMGGCTIGPRLNVIGAGGFKDTVRYLHLESEKQKTLCAPWEAVTSLEALLEYHVQEEERKRAE
jgi:hypothetical protein